MYYKQSSICIFNRKLLKNYKNISEIERVTKITVSNLYISFKDSYRVKKPKFGYDSVLVL